MPRETEGTKQKEARGEHDDDAEETMKLQTKLTEQEEEISQLRSELETKRAKDLETDLGRAQKLIEEEKTRGEDYLAQLKYLQADFENYRKRVEREIRDIEDFSTSSLIRRLLPVLDDMELAVSSAEKGDSGMVEGIRMVQKNLSAALQSEGLKPIDAVGKPFDPEFHEAVERIDGTGKSDRDMVVAEIRRGYTLKDKVLRPSMVRVESAAKKRPETSDKKENDDDGEKLE